MCLCVSVSACVSVCVYLCVFVLVDHHNSFSTHRQTPCGGVSRDEADEEDAGGVQRLRLGAGQQSVGPEGGR